MERANIRKGVIAVVLSLNLFASGCALLIAGAAAGGATGTVASVQDSRQETHSTMTYVGTVVANVGYVPAKVVFAGAGALTSGVAYLLTMGDTDASRSIWDASVGGNYVVRPSMIDGDEPLHFAG